MSIAIIPARGGSKRIPRKNVKPFLGKPMLAWSIAAAQAAGCFSRIIVSTDDAEIAEVARDYGADIPFLRPATLADDYTGTIPVIAHAIQSLQAQGETITEVCCIYATAPFIQASDLQHGLQQLRDSHADYAFSVTSYAFPIQRAIQITPEQRVAMFSPEEFNTRSQDLVPAYHDAAQFYWGKASAWLAGLPIFSPASCPIVLPRYRVQDIDTPEDWLIAEMLFKKLNNSNPEE